MSLFHVFNTFHDDGFEWSNDELRISQEVFYGNSSTSFDRSNLNGVVNFGCEESKISESPPLSSNAALTSDVSSKDSCLKDGDDIHEQAVPAKRVKLAIHELSSFKPLLEVALASSVPLKSIASGVHQHDSQSNCAVLMCHVVESSSDGVSSSCYLQQKGAEINQNCNFQAKDVPKINLSGSDGSEGKDTLVSNSISSPVSQESHATKIVVAGSSARDGNQSGSLQRAARKCKRGVPFEVQHAVVFLSGDQMKDSRALLHHQVFQLLTASGWCIEKRKRKCRSYEEFVFISPEGRAVRELSKAWNLCGQSFFAYGNKQVYVEYDWQWSDIDHFCSDLSRVLDKINNDKDSDSVAALARHWDLLDPFVTVVFVGRKIRALRAGATVKAKSNMRDGKSVIVINENVESKRNKSSECCGTMKLCDSSLATESTVSGCGRDSQGWEVETLKSRSVYVCEGSILHRVEDGICMDNIGSHPNFNSVPMITDMNMAERSGHSSVSSDDAIKSLPMKLKKVPVGKPHSFSENLSASHRSGQIGCLFPPKDDDLLISAINPRKRSKSKIHISGLGPERSGRRPLKKQKGRKGGRRLLPRTVAKGGRHLVDGRWPSIGKRTVLSWLIHSGVISLNEGIQYHDTKDGSIVKDGLITREGVLCNCCNKVLSVSEFKSHSGLEMDHPLLNLFMDSGEQYISCLLQAWSSEYKARKGARRTIEKQHDPNDDSCGICGDCGHLICCDNCPSTYHQSCLSAKELPEDSWYCPNCTCWMCGDLVHDEVEASMGGLRCCLCNHRYHRACVKDERLSQPVSNLWLCSGGCEEIYLGLDSQVGLRNDILDGYSWTLLKCILEDQKPHSTQRPSLKAECNSKLAVALTIMEECFLPMVDSRTGIDMIPHVLYNWGSKFPRLDYHGFYTMVLEKDDVIISAASIRIHGIEVAEMPLIATCSKYRRKGMCRRMLNLIEQLLISLKVEKLVITAICDLVEMWTVGFGFVPVEEEEKKSLNKVNLMVFPGTVMLKKALHGKQASDQVQEAVQAGDASLGTTEKSAESEPSGKDASCKDDHYCVETANGHDPESEMVEVQRVNEGLVSGTLNFQDSGAHPDLKAGAAEYFQVAAVEDESRMVDGLLLVEENKVLGIQETVATNDVGTRGKEGETETDTDTENGKEETNLRMMHSAVEY